MLTEQIKQFIKKDALTKSPNECCGLIFDDGKIISCENISKTPKDSFIIDLKYIKKQDIKRITGFYHSHEKFPDFSIADMAFSEKLKRICVLYVCDLDIFKEYHPNGMEIPYVGRPCIIEHMDCFTLFQDYYKKELNIIIPNIFDEYPYGSKISHDYWKTDEAERDFINMGSPMFIRDFLIKHGFIKVNDLQKHDVLISKIPPYKFEAHISIYLDNNQVLQYVKEFSTISPYQNSYKKMTTAIFRHQFLL